MFSNFRGFTLVGNKNNVRVQIVDIFKFQSWVKRNNIFKECNMCVGVPTLTDYVKLTKEMEKAYKERIRNAYRDVE